jgi:hypothetical protein
VIKITKGHSLIKYKSDTHDKQQNYGRVEYSCAGDVCRGNVRSYINMVIKELWRDVKTLLDGGADPSLTGVFDPARDTTDVSIGQHNGVECCDYKIAI